jgi:hypothetical protein
MSDVAVHDLVQKRNELKKRNRENYSRSGCGGRSSFALYFLRWTCSSGGSSGLAKPNG